MTTPTKAPAGDNPNLRNFHARHAAAKLNKKQTIRVWSYAASVVSGRLQDEKNKQGKLRYAIGLLRIRKIFGPTELEKAKAQLNLLNQVILLGRGIEGAARVDIDLLAPQRPVIGVMGGVHDAALNNGSKAVFDYAVQILNTPKLLDNAI